MLMSSIFLHAFVYLYLYINIVRTHNISYCNLEAFTSDLFLLSSAILYYFFFSLLLLLVYQLNSINDNIHVLCPCVSVVWKSKNKAVDSITFAYISIEMSVTGDGMEFEIRIRFPSIPIFHWHHIYHPRSMRTQWIWLILEFCWRSINHTTQVKNEMQWTMLPNSRTLCLRP